MFPIRALAFCALLGGLGLPGSVRAQVVASPESLRVTVAQGEVREQVLTLANAGGEATVYCLSFERPLAGAPGARRMSSEVLGSACGAYGEALALVDESAITDLSWNPDGLAMTPDGRLFVAENSGFRVQTYELTPELEIVRDFEHPQIGEQTKGVAFDTAAGTLWWLNVVVRGFRVKRAVLLEGDLDGVPTGRQVELPIAAAAPAPYETGSPVGLSFDSRQQRFYWVDFANDDVWAADTLGHLVEGYPIRLDAYPDVALGFGLGVHPDASGGAGVRLEVATTIPGLSGLRRLVVASALGEDTAPGAEPLETPIPDPIPGTAGGMAGEPLRSRLDPNGVIYYAWSEFQNAGVVAVRAHPVPPAWLVVESWDGALAAGGETEITLTFRPGARAVGTYEAVLQVFQADDTVVEVPLVLEVTPGTSNAEDEAVSVEARLSVWPNPAQGAATVALMLPDAGAAEVAVFDVLGRRVARLHTGLLAAGAHRFGLDAAALPSGVYLVRVTFGGNSEVRRVAVVR